MAKNYDADSISYDADSISVALSMAEGRGDIPDWKKNDNGTYTIGNYLRHIGDRTFTLDQAHAFLIGLITGRRQK